MNRIDLNADVGEDSPFEEGLLDWITSANVGCGAHAGSWCGALKTMQRCLDRGIRLGMHPGFPDRDHFGRVVPPPELRIAALHSLVEQIDRFAYAADAAYIKPHGACYNLICDGLYGTNSDFARACLETILDQASRHGIAVMLREGCEAHAIARGAGVATLTEAFADRAYRADGTLVPRSESNALITDPDQAVEQALLLAPHVDSLCIHGDHPCAEAITQAVYEALEAAGMEIGP